MFIRKNQFSDSRYQQSAVGKGSKIINSLSADR